MQLGLAREHPEQRRLAGAVRAGERDAVAALDAERDAVEEDRAGELLAQVGGDDDCHCPSRVDSPRGDRARARRRLVLGARAALRRAGRAGGRAAPGRRTTATTRTRWCGSRARCSSGAEPDAVSCFGHSLIALDGGRPAAHAGARLARRAQRAAGAAAAGPARPRGRARPHRPVPAPELLAGEARVARRDGAGGLARRRPVRLLRRLPAGRARDERRRSRPAPACSTSAPVPGTRSSSTASASTPARLPELADVPVWIDGACSNLGAGCIGARAALSVGTSGALRILYETERPAAAARPLPLPPRRAARRRGRRALGRRQPPRLARPDAPRRAAIRAHDHGLTFLPFLGGERSTGWDPDATGAVAGLTFETTPADLRQAALEGVAFRFAAIADAVARDRGRRRDGRRRSATTRRGSRSWPTRSAGRSSSRPSRRPRSAARRLPALQRTGCEAAKAPLGEVFEPREDRAEAYRSARERQQRLYEELRGQD